MRETKSMPDGPLPAKVDVEGLRLPWRVDEVTEQATGDGHKWYFLCDSDGREIAGSETCESMIFTAVAVNSHAALKIALECVETQLNLVAGMLDEHSTITSTSAWLRRLAMYGTVFEPRSLTGNGR